MGASEWGRCEYICVALRLDILDNCSCVVLITCIHALNVSPNPTQTNPHTLSLTLFYICSSDVPKQKKNQKNKYAFVSCFCFGTARVNINDIGVLGGLVRLNGVWRDMDVESKHYTDVLAASPLKRTSLPST